MKAPNVLKVGKPDPGPVEVDRRITDLTKSIEQIPPDIRPQWVKCASGEHEAFEPMTKDQISALCKYCRCLFLERFQ